MRFIFQRTSEAVKYLQIHRENELNPPQCCQQALYDVLMSFAEIGRELEAFMFMCLAKFGELWWMALHWEFPVACSAAHKAEWKMYDSSAFKDFRNQNLFFSNIQHQIPRNFTLRVLMWEVELPRYFKATWLDWHQNFSFQDVKSYSIN